MFVAAWKSWRFSLTASLALTLFALQAAAVSAQPLTGEALVEALRGGGYNIYFRHAPTDWQQQDRLTEAGGWTSCDPGMMRQLSDEGRAIARRIGEAIRQLRIPVGKVLSSEYCRSAETARLLDVGPVSTTRDIMNMRAADYVGGRGAVIRRARKILAARPPAGTNAVIVGHGNLMRAATDVYAGEAGSGIYAPGAEGGKSFKLVARLSPDEWARLAARYADDN